ncbi:MAG TPA: hypothetical protein VLM40_14065 [Gemmata sp.]|nr:hypothetical protein [Gemmata sp.]
MAIPLPTLDVLDSIVIPTHCPVSWDEMEGDERRRFCKNCQQPVHDITALTSSEARALLSKPGKRPCLRIYRRTDGRVMTADCPANYRERIWRWLGRRSAWAATMFAFFFLSGCKTPFMGLEPQDYQDTVLEPLPSGIENKISDLPSEKRPTDHHP